MRNHRPFSLLMMDIDNFKQRNDTFGHAAGDDALRALAQALLRAVRLGDLAARIGGEEFAILLAETGVEGAEAFAARIQAVLRAVDCGPGPALTVSIGISTLTARTPAWSDLVAQADEAMYQAKRAGKNRYLVSAAVLPAAIVAAEDPVG
jgi:diguanylate cyclase (GGDEF)-like protein